MLGRDMLFNEDSRVKIPSILHLTRLGYEYLSLKDSVIDGSSNIFTDVFKASVLAINAGADEHTVNQALQDASLLLDNDDLGKAFFERLLDQSGVRLLDLTDFSKNSFHVVTELTYKNGDDEFRPDIIILINGMPLVFIEVKKPNNREGVLAERTRINKRFSNKAFKRFVNITQFMIFSNNMEYSSDSPDPIEGAFYASPSYGEPVFNYFRDEENLDLASLLQVEDEATEQFLLKDTNYEIIKDNPEFKTNKNPDSPTNRIITSLLSKDRLCFLLKYALTYVKGYTGIEKHIMRYPQVFASKAITKKLDDGVRKGIIWHTQGSGKTALAYYNVKHLTDYYSKQAVIPKFYFIVDRLDLLTQATIEFESRGLKVHTVNSKDEFAASLRSKGAIHNLTGQAEITVVNIHKFKDDSSVAQVNDYDLNVQRIYFLDEVHRSYNPQGSFLANLDESDRNAIKIGLTGTPLIGGQSSKNVFGDYIHKYYYNASIADGYTLRLIREEIETKYKTKLQKALEEAQVLKGSIKSKEVLAHPKFAEPMLEYILKDFSESRIKLDDTSIGAMVICDSSEQAKMLHELFTKKPQPEVNPQTHSERQAEEARVKTAALILHDVGSNQERKDLVEDFKSGKIDILFVYNMLLTGFDAKRLKKLYLARVIRKHNLLQALTRVNRTYKSFRYGYVVDFADIQKEFDATNKAYFEELQSELGDEVEQYSNLFKSKEEIEAEIEDIKDVLWEFNTTNSELFSQQISQIEERKTMLDITRALTNARTLYNMIRYAGEYELLEKLDFRKLKELSRVANDHLALINLKAAMENREDNTGLLNAALEDTLFLFKKISEEELVIADELKNTLRQTREALADNFDKKDPEFITLKEELERLFKQKKLNEAEQNAMKQNISALRKIHAKIKELNRKNNLLKDRYNGDRKYARVHKRIMEKGSISQRERMISEALYSLKEHADDKVTRNQRILANESYFEHFMMPQVQEQFEDKHNLNLSADDADYLNKLVVKEYLNEYNGEEPW